MSPEGHSHTNSLSHASARGEQRRGITAARRGEGSRTLSLLVVDDDPPVLRACSEVAKGMGFAVHGAGSGDEARAFVSTHAPDVILMDLKMPGGGLSLLESIRTQRPRSSVVVMTAYATVPSAVEAMRIGATDYLTKPFAMDELTGVLERASKVRKTEMETMRVQSSLKSQLGAALIGTAPAMEKLLRIVQKVAAATHPVLILGESGAGKETVARAIHASGPMAGKRFAMLECGQLSPAVLEVELFGTAPDGEAGEGREGALVNPEGGTLFLDSISDMPLDLQGKLLRALQERRVRLSDTDTERPVSVRLLAASSTDLTELVGQGLFRKDLYYRLNIVSLRIPPLRERREDIPLLAEHFLERLRRESAHPYRLSADALQAMAEYGWPGNVRELEGAIEHACALSSGPMLYAGDLPAPLQAVAQQGGRELVTRVDEREAPRPKPSLAHGGHAIISIAELEREAILNTIRQLHGDKLMAAKLLGIGKTTLYRKLKEYGFSES